LKILDFLRKHEFDKHYTCAESDKLLSTELSYFSTGLKLRKYFNFYNILKKYNITPSNDIVYPFDIIKNTIDKFTNHTSIIKCDHSGILNEIWLCLNKNLELFDCPQYNNYNGCKHNQVKYKKIDNNSK
jgi:ribonuclease I